MLKARSVDMTLVPNVKGMGLRDALYLLENSGLKVGGEQGRYGEPAIVDSGGR